MKRTVLYTDLDGTLIDHHTYSSSVATTAIRLLKKSGIPVVFCSSKTLAEQLYLQAELNIDYPFIVENGSAIVFPNNYFTGIIPSPEQVNEGHQMIILAQKSAPDIADAIKLVNSTYPINLFGYAQSDNSFIAQMTGLQGEALIRAKARRFTETLFSEPPGTEVLSMLNNLGMNTVWGGRFLTVQDQNIDKGKAVQCTTDLFQKLWGERPTTIGIGDSPNDIPFLKVVDYPFLVQKHDGKWADINIEKLERIDAIGPNGFLKMVDKLLEIKP